MLTCNSVNYFCTKNIYIQYHFICKHIKIDETDIHYISTKNILANIFTKLLRIFALIYVLLLYTKSTHPENTFL